MSDTRSARRPAVAPTLGFLSGVAFAPAFVEPRLALLAAGGLLLAALGARRRPRTARQLFCAALIASGVWRECDDRQRYAATRQAIFARERVAELEIEGRVVRAPEEQGSGEWSLTLRGMPRGLALDRELRVSLWVQGAAPQQASMLPELGSGDRVRVWCRLSYPRRAANPGSSERDQLLRSRGIDAVGSVKSAALIERLERAPPGPLRWIDRAKREARRRLDLAVGREGDRRALLGAVLLGDRGQLSSPLLHRLRRSGLQHLVAISGFHVGVLALFTVTLLRRGGLSPWAVLATAALLFPAFGIGVGGRPSVVRAVVGTLVFLLGRCLGREGDPINTLALLAGAFVAAEPAVIGNAGYQLSFLATAGILLAATRSSLPAGLAVSIAAYLATAPRVAFFFGRLAPAAMLSNLPALPLCGVMLGSGYAAILLHDVPGLGASCARLCGMAVSALFAVMEFCGSFGLAALRVPPPSIASSALYYGLLLLWLGTAGRAARRLAAAAFALVALSIHLGPLPRSTAGWEATVLDVGQGQAVLLAGSGTGPLLVDAAGSWSPRFDPGEQIVLPVISSRGYRRLAALILSHEDQDHAGGAPAILRGAEVGELWVGPGWHRSPRLSEIAALARRGGTAVVLAEAGLQRSPGGIALRVLAPDREGAALRANDRSLVVLAGLRPCRLLLPGDAEREGESMLLRLGGDPRAEAMLMAHHGSRGGSSRELLTRVRPHHAIASCGPGNRFGHPHAETIERLREIGARIWRTDRHGAVRLRAGPSGWEVRGVLDVHEADRHQDERQGEDQDQ